MQVGDFSEEVFQSLGKVHPRTVPGGRGGQVRPGPSREPDSGISSARSTTTVPWSQNEHNVLPLPILDLPKSDDMQAEHQF